MQKKKKKNVAASAPAQETHEPTQANTLVNQNQTSGKKKKKGKATIGEADEVDKALSELSLK